MGFGFGVLFWARLVLQLTIKRDVPRDCMSERMHAFTPC